MRKVPSISVSKVCTPSTLPPLAIIIYATPGCLVRDVGLRSSSGEMLNDLKVYGLFHCLRRHKDIKHTHIKHRTVVVAREKKNGHRVGRQVAGSKFVAVSLFK